MADKSKKKRTTIQLRSTGKKKDGKSTGYFKTTVTNKQNNLMKELKKLVLKKYDPRAWNEEKQAYGMVVDFVEDKIKS